MSLRDLLAEYTPARFADGMPETFSVGWRVLWSAALLGDALVEQVSQGLLARYPGLGTPTAYVQIANDRKIVRSRSESDASHAARLRAWLTLHADRGTMRGLTREIQHYLGRTNVGGTYYPVRCVSRSGVWGIRDKDGVYTYLDQAAWTWDWDSAMPGTASRWSDMWVIVSPSPYGLIPTWQWADGESLGHAAPPTEVSTLRDLVRDWKAARTRVRAVIWGPEYSPDNGMPFLDPMNALSIKPDGQWGKWGKKVNGVTVRARPWYARFWEF